MRAPKYIGKKIVGNDSLPYTFMDLQHQIERALKQGATEQQIFALEWQMIERPFERLRILNYTIAVAAEELRRTEQCSNQLNIPGADDSS